MKNRVQLIGHVGQDPEIKSFEGGKKVANLNLATNDVYYKEDEKVEQTEWHDLELWDQQAKIAEKYLKKGSQIYVEGKIKSDKWTDEQGQNRKKTKIRVLSFTMVGGRPDGMGNANPSPPQSDTSSPSSKPTTSMSSGGGPDISLDDADDDLPF